MRTDLSIRKGKSGSPGFTLIEALIALCILAIASSALMAATGAHVSRIGRLEDRALAQIVAENRLSELRLAHARPGSSTDRVAMGSHEWDIATIAESTSDPNLVDTKISVSAAGANDVLLTLQGFIAAGDAP